MCQHGSGNVVTSNSQTEAQFPCERTRSMQLPTSYPTRSQAIQMFMKNAHQQNPFSGNSAIPARSEARRIGLRQATTRQVHRPCYVTENFKNRLSSLGQPESFHLIFDFVQKCRCSTAVYHLVIKRQ